MLLPDVNVLIYAHREDSHSEHPRFAAWIDAQHAAIAIEHGCTLVSTDSDFKVFPHLRWRHPFNPPLIDLRL